MNTPKSLNVNKDVRLKTLPQVEGPKLILGYIGAFLMFVGFLVLVPLIIIAFYPEESGVYSWFLTPGLSSMGLGAILFFSLLYKRRKGQLQKLQSYILLLGFWVIAIIIGAIPYIMSRQLNFSQSIFESASGFTTTALSLINTEDMLLQCDHVFHFYRCWMLFTGGIGLTLIVTSAISDANGLSLYNLEGHNDRLLPNVIKSARIIFLIYFAYIIVGICAYLACGMPAFDAVCNSISAISTGGYSIHANSISHYQSVGVEVITCILMLLGSTNFLIHFAIMRGKFKHFFMHCEFYCFLIMSAILLPAIIGGTAYTMNCASVVHPELTELTNPWQHIRYGLFFYISAVTTTGFKIDPYWLNGMSEPLLSFNNLPSFLFITTILCMLIGGQAGSTSGGIKQIRVVQIFKEAYWHIRDAISNKHVVHPRTIMVYGEKRAVAKGEFSEAASIVLIFVAVDIIGAFLISCFYTTDATLGRFDVALYEFTSVLTNSGLASGLITLTAPTPVYWIATIGMIIGRLEPIIFLLIIARTLRICIDKSKSVLKTSRLNK